MTEQPGKPPEQTTHTPYNAEELQVHRTPEAAARINRRVLFGVVGLLLLLLAGTVIIALDPPRYDSDPRYEAVEPGTRRPPEGLERLPRSYDEIVTPPLPSVTPPAPQILPSATQSPISPELPQDSATPDNRDALTSPIQFRLTTRPTASRNTTATQGPSPTTAQTAAQRLRAAELAARQSQTPPPGNQAGKQRFANAPLPATDNKHLLRTPNSPYTLLAGTVIAASLLTGLNSDLPGFVIAQVTENVYDTVTGRHLLIPQGARLVGKYDSSVAVGQDRALVVWQRILLPDGASLQIDNLPATDPAGFAGLKDRVDRHTWQLLQGIALATVLGIGSELATGSAGDNDLARALVQSTQSTTNRAGQRVVERQLNVQPTITIRPGWPLRVVVQKDLVLRSFPSAKARP